MESYHAISYLEELKKVMPDTGVAEAAEVGIKAIRRLLPKTPLELQKGYFKGTKRGNCPECGRSVNDNQKCCDNCGQRLNWEAKIW